MISQFHVFGLSTLMCSFVLTGTSSVLFADGAESPFDHNLTSLYHFDEPESATAFLDSSFSGNNGSCVGAACPTTGELGKFNSAALFDGNDEVVVSDNSNLDNTAALSFQVWFMPTINDGSPRGIVSKRTSSSSNQAYSLFMWTGSQLNVDINKQSTNNRFAITPTVTTNRWYHVVVTYDGSLAAANRVNVYFNGALEASSPHTDGDSSIPDYASDLHIGTLNAGYAQGFGGLIDEVATYQDVLPEDYIAGVYDRGSWRYHLQMQLCGGRFCNFTDPSEYVFQGVRRSLFSGFIPKGANPWQFD